LDIKIDPVAPGHLEPDLYKIHLAALNQWLVVFLPIASDAPFPFIATIHNK